MHVSKRVIRIRTCLGSVNLKTFRCVTFSSSSTSLKLKYAFSLFYNRRFTLTDKKSRQYCVGVLGNLCQSNLNISKGK